jgi:ABC-type branched-subunit amino acid transport system ATPase component
MGAALKTSGLTVRFGGVVALDDASLELAQGERLGVVGPNGAGKTTLVRALAGTLRVSAGRVELGGVDVTGHSPAARAAHGLARTYQQPALFPDLTVREHLVVAHHARTVRLPLLRDLLPKRSGGRDEAGAAADALLEQLSLRDVADEPASRLSLGTVRLVEVGRALATRPRVLLLDEPFSGLDAVSRAELAGQLVSVSMDHRISFLLVEHDIDIVRQLTERVKVFDFGRQVAEGRPDEVMADAAVQTAYLGGTR